MSSTFPPTPSYPSELPTSPSSAAPAGAKPIKIREELMTSTRLAPKVQLLYHARSQSIQEISHQVLLLVLACAKCYATADKDPPRVGVLGGGNVGCAVVMTLLASGYRAAHVALSTRQPDRIPRCDALRAPSALPLLQSVPRYYDNARLARESDVLVLCMPPSQLKSVAIQVRHALAANVEAPPLVISALCGVTLQSLTKACGSQAVVRVQPDVAEIARQWQCPKDEEGQAQSLCGATATLPVVELTAIQQESAERSRQQRLPLRLAAEALAPHREDVRELYHAFVLFARRVSDQEGKLAEVLFGQQSDVVMAALDSHADDERQKQQKTAVETPSWPVEWEQDLAELQTRLAEHALE